MLLMSLVKRLQAHVTEALAGIFGEQEDASRSRKTTVTDDLVDRLLMLFVIYASQRGTAV